MFLARYAQQRHRTFPAAAYVMWLTKVRCAVGAGSLCRMEQPQPPDELETPSTVDIASPAPTPVDVPAAGANHHQQSPAREKAGLIDDAASVRRGPRGTAIMR